MLLIVSIALLYTYTNRNHQYTRKRVAVYLHVLMIHCRLEILRRRSEAFELPTSGHRWGMEGTIKVLMVFIGLLYTYPMRNHQYIRKRVMHSTLPRTIETLWYQWTTAITVDHLLHPNKVDFYDLQQLKFPSKFACRSL